MKTKSILLAGLASLAALVVPVTYAAVLDFEGPTVCAGNTDATGNGALAGCFNYAFIAQSYGDVASVMDVQYSAPRLTDTSLRWWDGAYNNLSGVAWADGGDSNSKARIDLKPLNGQAVMLTHFDLGAYPNTTRGTKLTISDLSGNVLMTNDYTVGTGNLAMAFNGVWIGQSGIRIEWEDSAFNVGIDNITYEMTSAVPEPETYAMLVAGLSLLALRARRRKA